jgi:hypothetical protein
MKSEMVDMVAYDCGNSRQQRSACEPFANIGQVRILFILGIHKTFKASFSISAMPLRRKPVQQAGPRQWRSGESEHWGRGPGDAGRG